MKWLAAVAVVLVAAVALQLRSGFDAQENHPKPDLRGALAVSPPGWSAQDLPLGQTESVQEATEKTLRYDDYVFRRYVRGAVEFTVYVAYWSPGKHPPQMVAQHTPDMCWTMNGMTCPEMRFNVPMSIGASPLWPGQWRKFLTPGGQPTYTMFWHLVGDRPFDYGEHFYSSPNPITYWYESLKFVVGAKRPQLFFRITSNVPIEKIWGDPAMQSAMSGFVELGLGKTGK